MTNSTIRTRSSAGSLFSRRPFQLKIHNGELAQLQAWVLLHENIETGGDLFGLWSTDNTAVVHLVLGPGEHSRRTPTSFFQDAEYLKDKGRQLTQEYGLCHIGEWHSHHTLDLAKPNSKDESTIWSLMPSNGFKRFIVCIANIDRGESSKSHAYRPSIGRENCVGLVCFLFEVKDTVTWERCDMLQGSFSVIDGQSAYRKSRALHQTISVGAESVHSPHEVNVKEQMSISRGWDVTKTGNSIVLYSKSRSTSLNYDHHTAINRSFRDLTSVSKSGIAPVSDTSSRTGTPSQTIRTSHGGGGRSLATVESAKPTSRMRPQTPSGTSSRALRGSGSNRQAVTSIRETLKTVGAPLWDVILPSHQSLLENLAHNLSGDLIKELDAVTIHFKVGVPSKYDLACKLVCHDDRGHTLKLYTSGLASTPTLTIDLNRQRANLAANTIFERILKTVAGVTAKMPARNQVISAAVSGQNPQTHEKQNTSSSLTNS